MSDHRKIDVVITAEPAKPQSHLSAALQRAAAAHEIVVGAQAFDAQGHISTEAAEVIRTVMGHGGTVLVDLPASARQADTFNAFAHAVLSGADDNKGKLLFAGQADALVATAKAPAAPRR